MARMRAVDAAVLVLEKEGVHQAFGVPGAAINPLYSALRKNGHIAHVLARHVEAASHMAEGYTRTAPGHIGVCIGTSGPAGCKWAVTVREPALVPQVFQQAFHVMRSGRPGPVLIDLPLDVQLAEIEFDPDTYAPLAVYKPTATKAQIEKALDMLEASEHPLIVAGGGVINADATDLLVQFAELTGVPVIPTLMGWGAIGDSHPLMAGMVGLQTSHRGGNANLLASDLVLGIGNRWANRHTGSPEVYAKGRKILHVDIEPTQIGRVFMPDYGITSDAKAALELFIAVARERKAAGKLKDRSAWASACRERVQTLLRKWDYDQIPIKPHRVYKEMVEFFDANTRYVTTIGLSQIAAAQLLKVEKPRHWINAGQAGPLGWTMPAA
ncbi:MAG: glyoxylate carboligase, partial [Thiomonas sp. 14-64-326]